MQTVRDGSALSAIILYKAKSGSELVFDGAFGDMQLFGNIATACGLRR